MMEIWLLVFFCPVNPRDSSGKAIIPLKYFIFSLLHIGKHSLDVKWHLKKKSIHKILLSLYADKSQCLGPLLFISTTICLLCLHCIVGRNVSANKKNIWGRLCL